MSTTEEIIVSGDDFIERRIFICPQQVELDNLQQQAYGHGYNRGWMRGFFTGTAFIAAVVLFVWLAAQF